MNDNQTLALFIVLAILVIYISYSLLTVYSDGEKFVGDTTVVNDPIMPYYRTFDARSQGQHSIVVTLHYTDWCSYCKRMKPVWEKVKQSLSGPQYSGITFVENDEDKFPTVGVESYPTIVKLREGKARKYLGRADFDQIRKFILSPFQNQA